MLKKFIIGKIEKYLFDLANQRLKDKKAFIIAVTGSVGKSSSKEAIKLLLESFFPGKVFASHGNMNESVGLPMSVLGFDYVPSKVEWPRVLMEAKKKAKNKQFPDYLIVEMGVEKPGDIEYFTKLVKPNIALITNIGPAHLEGLGDIEGVLKEKANLFKSLSDDGVAIFCNDDEKLAGLAPKLKSKKLSYGFSKGSNVSAKIVKAEKDGILLEVDNGKLKKQIRTNLIGNHMVLALLSAMAVAEALELDFDKSVKALKEFKPLNGRMSLIEGIKKSLIIDDSYNANPNSVLAALETLKNMESSGRKVVILGNMNELGKFEESAHKIVSKAAGTFCDLMIFIGPNSGVMKEAAESELTKRKRKAEIMVFETPSRAILSLDEIIQENDLILVKASQNRMRFEKIVEALMAHPERAKELLARQDKRWRK
jgi:UDP-N-acetylmuramoyl-tripeptide--D-alanyl-D-alanine ligase